MNRQNHVWTVCHKGCYVRWTKLCFLTWIAECRLYRRGCRCHVVWWMFAATGWDFSGENIHLIPRCAWHYVLQLFTLNCYRNPSYLCVNFLRTPQFACTQLPLQLPAATSWCPLSNRLCHRPPFLQIHSSHRECPQIWNRPGWSFCPSPSCRYNTGILPASMARWLAWWNKYSKNASTARARH